MWNKTTVTPRTHIKEKKGSFVRRMRVEENMDIAEVLGGIFFLILGILAFVPLPIDGWFYEPTPGIFVIALVAGSFFIILGGYLVVAGLRSKKKSPTREVVGIMCLMLSCFILFIGLFAESEIWTRVFLILGLGFLVVGVGAFLVGFRKAARKSTPKP